MKNQALIPNKTGDPADVSSDLAALAAELAKDLVPAEQVGAAWGLDAAELGALLTSPEFSALLSVERAKWNSPENTNRRLKLKGQMAVESGALSMAEIVNNPEAGPIARIKAFAELVRIGGADNAGLDKAAASGRGGGLGAGDRFSVSIHIGAGHEIEVSAPNREGREGREEAVLPALEAEYADEGPIELGAFTGW